MSVLRFLLTPRWLGLLAVVIVLGFACVKLSEWQFHRYQERHDDNAVVRTAIAAPAVPVAQLLSRTAEPSSDTEYRTVTATGRYDADHQVAVLYRTRDGAPGIDVLTPLITRSGTAVLVDRGWMHSAANGNQVQQLPPPAAGTVTVTGRVRIDSDGGTSQVTPSQGSVRAISASALRPGLPYPVYDGFLDLTTENPASRPAPAKAAPPSLSGGPSFFYGWQWLFFALLFFGFYVYFAWSEYQEKVHGRIPGRRRQPHRPTAAPSGPPALTDDPSAGTRASLTAPD